MKCSSLYTLPMSLLWISLRTELLSSLNLLNWSNICISSVADVPCSVLFEGNKNAFFNSSHKMAPISELAWTMPGRNGHPDEIMMFPYIKLMLIISVNQFSSVYNSLTSCRNSGVCNLLAIPSIDYWTNWTFRSLPGPIGLTFTRCLTNWIISSQSKWSTLDITFPCNLSDKSVTDFRLEESNSPKSAIYCRRCNIKM